MTITDKDCTDRDCLAETLAFNEHYAATAGRSARAETPDAGRMASLRRNRLGGDTPSVRLPQGHYRVTADGVRARVLVPDQVDGVYLHLHGGGWAFGSADGQDERLWRLAEQARVAVVSVEYRLAPENPFPAGPDDCESAARWLVEHGATLSSCQPRIRLVAQPSDERPDRTRHCHTTPRAPIFSRAFTHPHR